MKEKEVNDKGFDNIDKACLNFKVHQTYGAVQNLRDVAEGILKEPDPQADGPDGIVKAVHEHYGQWPSPRLLGLAQAIETQIEAVRKENDRCFARTQGSELSQALRTVERKVSDIPALWENDEQKGRKITGLERKVEELEKLHEWITTPHTHLPKPQPFPEQSRGVARDKDGWELKPGVSLIRDNEFRNIGIFHSVRDDGRTMAYWFVDQSVDRETSGSGIRGVTKLFDLDFPPGGDK